MKTSQHVLEQVSNGEVGLSFFVWLDFIFYAPDDIYANFRSGTIPLENYEREKFKKALQFDFPFNLHVNNTGQVKR